LGYIEGKNLIIEYRYADGRPERLPALAEELVRLKVDIIVTDTAAPARAARKATSTIPIVMVSAGNPIQAGLVASLARPGGNVTGLTGLTGELLGKRFELLKEVVPKVTRFAFLDDDDIVDLSPFKYAQEAAQALGVRLDRVEVKTANPDFDGAFRMMAKERVGAVITSAGFLSTTLHRKRILDLLEQARLPAIHGSTPWVADGGLMYYGVNSSDLYRRAATYVDKILKGTKPAELPVEQPTKFELIINLKAAKQIGLTIPPNVLARADRVIR
jgi:putative ABC transport system substrate-binding protein